MNDEQARSWAEGGDQVPAAGYDASRLNALQHGILSKFTTLPWEDPAEYDALLRALTEEHAPTGPTEEHLVEELAGAFWRKRRLRLAEAATYHRALKAATENDRGTTRAALVLADKGAPKVDIATAVKRTGAIAQRDLVELEADRSATLKALDVLSERGAAAYAKALELLDESTRSAWADQLDWEPGDYEKGEKPYIADADSLKRYLESAIMPWYDEQRAEIAARPQVRAQALGEALDPDKLERLGRYEVHLDRKLERTLSTLLRLQEMRRGRLAPPTAI